MTTSNQTIYELDRDTIVKAAMRKVGALASGQTPSSQDYADAQVSLNALVAIFQKKHGMPLWAREDYTLTLVDGTASYTFGIGQTINIPFPLTVHGITLENSSGGKIDAIPVSKSEFDLLSTNASGTPNSYMYQPRVNYGVLSLWPTPDATAVSTYTCVITYQRPFEGFTASAETPDFPQEWQNALIYNLAYNLAPEYGLPKEDRLELKEAAKMYLEDAMDGSAENASLFFQVNRR